MLCSWRKWNIMEVGPKPKLQQRLMNPVGNIAWTCQLVCKLFQSENMHSRNTVGLVIIVQYHTGCTGLACVCVCVCWKIEREKLLDRHAIEPWTYKTDMQNLEWYKDWTIWFKSKLAKIGRFKAGASSNKQGSAVRWFYITRI